MGVPKDTCIRYCICREDKCFTGTGFTILSGLYGEPRGVGGWMGTYLRCRESTYILHPTDRSLHDGELE